MPASTPSYEEIKAPVEVPLRRSPGREAISRRVAEVKRTCRSSQSQMSSSEPRRDTGSGPLEARTLHFATQKIAAVFPTYNTVGDSSVSSSPSITRVAEMKGPGRAGPGDRSFSPRRNEGFAGVSRSLCTLLSSVRDSAFAHVPALDAANVGSILADFSTPSRRLVSSY